MFEFNFNVQNIEDGQGLAIALMGMAIVFIVLIMISAFIVILPRLLAVVARKFPEMEMYNEQAQNEDEGPLLAAIGFVMHKRRTGRT